MGLQMMQQLTGINAVVYYLFVEPYVFKQLTDDCQITLSRNGSRNEEDPVAHHQRRHWYDILLQFYPTNLVH